MRTIGIDIGGTQTRVAVFENEILVTQTRFVTRAHDPQAQITQLVAVIDELTPTYEAIGVACPGPLDLQQGIVLNPPNLPGWHQFALRDVLSQATKRPVVLENDANLASFAEASIGAGQNQPVVQFITLSTGVGAGLVIDGKIFQGARGLAQEVANCLVDETCHVPGATLAGSVERICSGTGIQQLAQQSGLQTTSTAQVFELAKHGNEQAQQLLDYVSGKLANFLASLQGIIDPSVIVIGGSVALHNPEFIKQLENQVKAKVYPTVAPHVKLVLAECGDDAGVIGAGLWAHHQFVQGGSK